MLTQTLPDGWDLEWCIEGDGADLRILDPSGIPREAVLSDPRVSYMEHKLHLGAAQTRNIAVARSRGDVLVHLDADDVLLPGALSKILPLFDLDDVAWVGVRVDDLVDNQTQIPHPPRISGAVSPGTVSQCWLDSDRSLPFHSVAFSLTRRAFLRSGGYPALPAAEDVGLVLSVTDAAPGVVLDDLLALYRKWSLQTTQVSSSYAALRPACLEILTQAVASRLTS